MLFPSLFNNVNTALGTQFCGTSVAFALLVVASFVIFAVVAVQATQLLLSPFCTCSHLSLNILCWSRGKRTELNPTRSERTYPRRHTYPRSHTQNTHTRSRWLILSLAPSWGSVLTASTYAHVVRVKFYGESHGLSSTSSAAGEGGRMRESEKRGEETERAAGKGERRREAKGDRCWCYLTVFVSWWSCVSYIDSNRIPGDPCISTETENR